MANPFREGGSLNIPTQDAADYLFEKKYGISRSGSDKMGDGSQLGPIEGYHTGDTRRAITDYLETVFFNTSRPIHRGSIVPRMANSPFWRKPKSSCGYGIA
jgi:hypothetical protein